MVARADREVKEGLPALAAEAEEAGKAAPVWSALSPRGRTVLLVLMEDRGSKGS